jgi:hypothetical protein
MPTCRALALAALLFLALIPAPTWAQAGAQALETTLTGEGLQVSLDCPAPVPPTLTVSVDGASPVDVTPVPTAPTPVNLALVIDRSTSMQGAGTPHSTRLADAALLATALLEQMAAPSQASLVSFDSVARLEAPASPGSVAAHRALRALEGQPTGAERTATAAQQALLLAEESLGDESGRPRVIVIFTAHAQELNLAESFAAPRPGTRLAVVELGDTQAPEAEPVAERPDNEMVAPAAGALHISFHTRASAALPELFASFQRRSAALVGGSGHISALIPGQSLSPGRHVVRVTGCGPDQEADFEVAGAPAQPPLAAMAIATLAIAAFGGHRLWRRRQARRAEKSAHDTSATARYRSPLEVTTARRRAAEHARSHPYALVWDGGEQHTFQLTARQCTIGRDHGCTVRIESEWVSGLHARLSLLGEGLEIADLGSTNGTFVGDAGGPLRPNAPVTLAFGEVVRIGPQVRLTVHLAEDAQLNEARP